MRSLTPVSAALALCALALPLSIAGTNLALAALTLALAARARRDGKLAAAAWRAEPALAALAAYAAVGLVSAAFSSAPGPSLRDAVKDLHRIWALGLFTAALALEPDAPLRKALGASFAAAALYGIGQTVFGGRPHGLLVRAHAFVHPVVFGEQMAFAVLGGSCVLLRPTEKATRTAAALFTALAATALLLNMTRMSLFAACAGFAATALLEPRARRWALPVIGALAAVALAWEFLPNNERTLSSLFASYDPANPQHARWALWDTALRMFRDHPLLGVGPGGYGRHFDRYFAHALDGQHGWSSAHNLYLHQAAERGLAGALVLLALCATLALRALRAAGRDADTRALWSAASMCAFLVMSVTETVFHNEQLSTLLLLIWAWGTISLRPRRENL